jgi:aspartate-semialdehyde dehydrogenase
MSGEAGSKKIPVAVLGATGGVGQRFVSLLADHPWFEVVAVTASERSAGRPYRHAVDWMQSAPIPDALADEPLRPTEPVSARGAAIAFSALDSAVAGPIEEDFARAGLLVVSNSKNHRMDPHVPLLVPEVNADHLELIRHQELGGGAIVTNPNCSTIGLVLSLKPLAEHFGLEAVSVVTLQALSGAGVPGVAGMRAVDNVIPFIGEEEDKMERETHKILGRVAGDRIEPHPVRVSAQCNRVSVVDGHTECVSVKLEREADANELRRAWTEFEGEPQRLGLPMAPTPPLIYLEAPDAPQPRLHRDLGGGMAVAVGRLRRCGVLGWKYVTLSHNTVRGAAGGAILAAELVVEKGLVRRSS